MRVRVSLWAGCALGVALAACSRPADPTTWKPTAVDDPTAERPWNVARIAERVAKVRGLPLREPIAVEPIDAEGLARRFGAFDPRVFETDAFWHAFGLAPAGVSVAERARSGLAANTLGLYDAKDRRLFVREVDTTSEDQRLAIVHEIEHALAYQSFRTEIVKGHGADEERAMRSLLEGDADLTMFAYRVKVQAGTDHWVERLVNAAAHRDLLESMSPKLDAELPLTRVFREFPYRSGTAFVGEMFRLGGFAMVDALYTHPPMSSEQIIDPDKYLAGDLPVPVAKPIASEGYVDVDSGRLGELVLGVLLAQCGGAKPGDAAGWGGDAYSVVTDYAGKLAALVSTVWDDVDAATRFERRIAARARCLADKSGTPVSGVAPADLGVRRDGARVAFVEGLAPEGRDAELQALLALVGERPIAAPPFGASCTPAPLVVPEDAFVMRGYDEDDRYVSEPLGLVVPLTSFASMDRGAVEVALGRRDPESYATANVRVMMTSFTPELERRLVTTFSSRSEELAPTLRYDGVKEIYTSVGPARAYHWVDSGVRERALVLAPFCDGLGTFMLDANLAGLGAWDEIRELLESIELHAGAPACLWLKANRGEPTPPKTCTLP